MIQENNQQLHRVATEVDLATGYEAGTCLAIIYYHLANRRWQVDMDQPLIHSKSVGF